MPFQSISREREREREREVWVFDGNPINNKIMWEVLVSMNIKH